MKYVLCGTAVKNPAEDIIVSLFPQEKLERVSKLEEKENGFVIRFQERPRTLRADVDFWLFGKCFSACAQTAKLQEKQAQKDAGYEAIKKAVFRAVHKSGRRPMLWGALTGVHPSVVFEKELNVSGNPEKAAQRLSRRYFVSGQKAGLLAAVYSAQQKVLTDVPEKGICLYAGIPFCPSKCSYCSFVSMTTEKDSFLKKEYLKKLHREIEEKARTLEPFHLPVLAVYLGGGTPTTLDSEELFALITHMKKAFSVAPETEFTVEGGRPDTLSLEKMQACAQAGATRFCINPQSMRDETLERIGRRHSADDIRAAFLDAKRVNRFDINADLIAGLPGESGADFLYTLTEILKYQPENITIHALSLKKGAQLKNEPPDKNLQNALESSMQKAYKMLKKYGYHPYYLYRQKHTGSGLENTGWCKDGKACLYNILTMNESRNILACGAGASTKLLLPNGKAQRIYNPKYPREYIACEDFQKACGEIAAFYEGRSEHENHSTG